MTIPRTPSAGAIPPTLAAALRDRFQLERELGQGGMATVYLAHDLKHGRQVAVKVLRPEVGLLLGRDRFEREVRLASSLNHPHIVPVYDSGEAAGFLYFVMPAVDGESLSAKLARERHLSVDEAMRVLVEVSEALDFAHARGIVHRDIKPGNILLSGGHALVADFGIALAMSKVDGDRLTETGLSMGTPAYMSPEQAAGHRDMDGRTDQYSLACVLYEMLGGEPPFAGSTPRSVMARQLADPPPPLATLRPGLPEGMEAALQRALSKIPVDRFPSVATFAAAVTDASTGAVPRRPASGPAWTVSRRRAAVIGLVVLSAAAWAARRYVWTPSPVIRSLAVLPIEPLADTALTYLADGVQEEIVTALAQAGGMQIKPRVAARSFWNRDHSIPAVASGLSVDAVLSTRIVPGRDSLRVTVQLIRGSSQDIMAAHSYVRPVAGVLQLAADVARDVVGDAQARLTREQAAHLASARRVSPEAYDLVQRASFTFSGDAGHLSRARDLLLRATDIDPTYAEAWLRLSGVLVGLTQYGVASPQDVGPQALEAARRAVTLDSMNAKAHAALASAEYWVNWDRAAADREYAKARELSPGTLGGDAGFLILTGRFDEGIALARQRAADDPLSGETSLNIGWGLFNAHRYAESLAALRRTLATHPEIAGYAHEEIAWNLAMLDSADAASAEMKLALPDTARTTDIVTLSGAVKVFAVAGRTADARRRLAELVALTRAPHVDPYPLIASYLALGDRPNALRALERVYAERWPSMMFLQVEPWLPASFRALPRVRELFALAGLPAS